MHLKNQYNVGMSVLNHLHSRHLDTNLHTVWVDEEDYCATFPLWNLSGRMVGYHHYRPNAPKLRQNDPLEGRYFTRAFDKNLCVWGLESFHLTPDVLFMTEGVFDACRLTEKGASAVAVLCNDPAKELLGWLTSLNRLVVAVCDNDENNAGNGLAKFADVAVCTDKHDLGDSSDEVVDALLNAYGLPTTHIQYFGAI